MLDTFKFNGAIYRLASSEATRKAQDHGGHIYAACTHCGQTMWQFKGLALTNDGGYSGARHIFYIGESAECTCPASHIRHVEFSHQIEAK